jgi:DNA-3-methyladenine glycosylase
MEEKAQVRRARGTPIPPFEPKKLEGWGTLLSRSFFEGPPEHVAPRLLGKVLAHRTGGLVLAGRIVEVEAYLGPHNDPPDPAAHSHRGPTPRNLVLFGPAGYSYVYFIYGMYSCMNVSCESEGQGGGILLRALEPLPGANGAALARMARNRGLLPGAKPSLLTAGPGRLCQALGLNRKDHNGLDLVDPASPLQIRDDGWVTAEVLVTARIGIREAVDWPLRFALPGHHCVSGAKSLTGQRIFLD